MKLTVNGVEHAFSADIPALLNQLSIDAGGRGFAVAVNGRVVPRGRWAETHLNDGDRVEVVHPQRGG